MAYLGIFLLAFFLFLLPWYNQMMRKARKERHDRWKELMRDGDGKSNDDDVWPPARKRL